MSADRNELTQPDKFRILYRDGFKCRYCGASPGSSEMEVDHLVPVSIGGSNSDENLVAACKKCNRGRSDQPLFPADMVIGTDLDGWQIIKRFGAWAIKACQRGVVVAGAIRNGDPVNSSGEYWFEIKRAHEMDWEYHIGKKPWKEPHRFSDFLDCLNFARILTEPKSK